MTAVRQQDAVRQLTGWGRTAPTYARVVQADPDLVAEEIAGAGPRGVIARGLGRAYGDAAQNGGGTVIQVRPTDPAAFVIDDDGCITVSAGTSLDALMRALLPRGFFVPVTPGTRYVTVGGAIAADIHGKNHHLDGSFGRHLVALELVDGCGRLRRLDPASTPELFWATVGGMGLTGVVVRATLRLRRVATSLMSVDTRRLGSLAALMEAMARTDGDYPYSVAWIDLLARGDAMGRAVLSQGRHASTRDVGSRSAPRPFAPRSLISVPRGLPWSVVGRRSVRAFNEAWFRRAPHRRIGQIETIGSFFHPLDGIGDWNRLYGRSGLVQYQFVVPFGAEDALTAIVARISESGEASFLAVLKRFGAANPGPLSFPMPGWTLALDLPARASLAALLDEIDTRVAGAGGRIYLAKDSRATPETIEAMYPDLASFRAVRAELDPAGVFVSDLARRLGLDRLDR